MSKHTTMWDDPVPANWKADSWKYASACPDTLSTRPDAVILMAPLPKSNGPEK